MNTDTRQITVSGVEVQIVRKAIKNLHLGVYPPNGRVRVAAPLAVSDDAVRLAVVSRLGWIKRQRAKFEAQPRQSEREMVSGESHYFLGRRYRLRVIEHNGPAKMFLRGNSSIDLHIPKGSRVGGREQVLRRWYRTQLKALIPPLLDKWQPVLGVRVAGWGVKKMKTKWGSCTSNSRRIWLNLELGKKPPQCLEYLIVHELAHLIDRHHDDRFVSIMDTHLPEWRMLREELNRSPIGHATWKY
jgi:predicted metal-dependent hydrolase